MIVMYKGKYRAVQNMAQLLAEQMLKTYQEHLKKLHLALTPKGLANQKECTQALSLISPI